jgi:alkanesulfonate monooxygenase SsuD/methylene tetrahydromethanopterin reductase-like flavin-dependent oxidoreductase (luciferase family)
VTTTTAVKRVSFGVKTSQSSLAYDEIVRVWREADDVEVFEHAWLWDHMVPLRGEVTGAALEAWTLLSALAAQTTRLRLGVIVTSNRLRPPALLAKMAATVDVISGGRLDFGIGAGGSRAADPQVLAGVHREYDAYGIDVVSPGEALGALDETCTIVKRMWAESGEGLPQVVVEGPETFRAVCDRRIVLRVVGAEELRCSYDPKNGEGCALAIRRAVRAEMLARKFGDVVGRADVSFVDAARLGK